LQETTGSSRKYIVLMVEDNPADVALVQEALKEYSVDCELVVVHDGEKAIQHIGRIDQDEAESPALVILDLNLPRRHGREVLSAIRGSRKFDSVPVVVLSSSIASRDIAEAEALGATQYVRKPMDLEEYMQVGSVVKSILSGDSGALGAFSAPKLPR
jgi:two-component system, chemotaxis family, response regulator Rcp1